MDCVNKTMKIKRQTLNSTDKEMTQKDKALIYEFEAITGNGKEVQCDY
jgi:hypothetical protein